jgi:hypothetical protein
MRAAVRGSKLVWHWRKGAGGFGQADLKERERWRLDPFS